MGDVVCKFFYVVFLVCFCFMVEMLLCIVVICYKVVVSFFYLCVGMIVKMIIIVISGIWLLFLFMGLFVFLVVKIVKY